MLILSLISIQRHEHPAGDEFENTFAGPKPHQNHRESQLFAVPTDFEFVRESNQSIERFASGTGWQFDAFEFIAE